MFNSTFKRSVVTLGVVAGLLAAAGPAGAQGGGVDFTRVASPQLNLFSTHLENTMISGYNVKAGAALDDRADRNANGVTEELFGNYNFLLAAEGTQVGSEGVTAPTKTDGPDGRKPQGTYDMASPY